MSINNNDRFIPKIFEYFELLVKLRVHKLMINMHIDVDVCLHKLSLKSITRRPGINKPNILFFKAKKSPN